jgi:MFS family permease
LSNRLDQYAADGSALQGNVRRFIAFRIFFNARFYYPVLGVLFLDLGITLDQYAFLNVVWAATILTMEIPSGALADSIGRRPLVVAAGGLMVLEMSVLAFAPAGVWLFPVLLANRLVSGLAEACASGADEALAYDSLSTERRDEVWRGVLARLVRWKSAAFFATMILGALAFDPSVVFDWLGVESPVTTRWPVYLTLAMSLGAFWSAWGMREPPVRHRGRFHMGEAFARIWAGARVVCGDRRIALLLLTAVLCDSLVRIFLTFGSNYYRLIEIPPVVNGFLGSAYALPGFFAASLAAWMGACWRPARIFLCIGGLVFLGLAGLSLATPFWGVWVVVPLALAGPLLAFFVSTYLNEWCDSSLRATVLSFRGVAMNLGYGSAGLAFGGLAAAICEANPGWSADEVFRSVLPALPVAFVMGAAALLVIRKFMASTKG